MSNPNSALPRFTFIAGPSRPACEALATLIASRDSSMLVEDFERPLREATLALFYHNDVLSNTLEDRNRKLPLGGAHSVNDWLSELSDLLEDNFGAEALGEMALNDHIAQGWTDVFDRTLYRDLQTPDQLVPFIMHYDSNSCLVLNLGPLATSQRQWPCPLIWLPQLDAPKQLAALDHELTQQALL